MNNENKMIFRVMNFQTVIPDLKFSKYQSSILCHGLFKCELSNLWVKRITYLLSNHSYSKNTGLETDEQVLLYVFHHVFFVDMCTRPLKAHGNQI